MNFKERTPPPKKKKSGYYSTGQTSNRPFFGIQSVRSLIMISFIISAYEYEFPWKLHLIFGDLLGSLRGDDDPGTWHGVLGRKSTPTKPNGVGPEECPMSSAANYVAVITGAEIAIGIWLEWCILDEWWKRKISDSEFMIEKGGKDLITMCSFLLGLRSRIARWQRFSVWEFSPRNLGK